MTKDKSKVNLLKVISVSPLLRGLVYMFVTLTIAIIVSLFFYNYNQSKIRERTDIEQLDELDQIVGEIQSQLRFSGTPLLLVADNESIVNMLENDDQLSRKVVSHMLLSMITSMENIDQLRIIDVDGQEVVRVDRTNEGESYIVSDDNLQNKSDRYYFVESLKTKGDEIYVSPLDLNIEHGEIELPVKPMIRIGKAITSSSGDIVGIMVINIKGQKLIDVIEDKKIHKNDALYLLNSDGYYLYGSQSADFAFMYDSINKQGFFNDYKEVWDDIEDGKVKSQYNQDNYYLAQINPIEGQLLKEDNVRWFIAMRMHKEDIMESENIFNSAMRTIVVIMLPILLVISFLLGLTQAKNKLYEEDLLQKSTYDNLTGVYNRGVIMKMLHQMIELAKRNKEPLAILYIDINDLKHVNDNIGHNMGDNMIIAASDSIKEGVRRSDFVSRIGGDEFLVLLPNCKEENVSRITMKIATSFAKSGMEYTNDTWEMSYGCAVYREGETLNQFIQRADRYMYENKRAKKG